MLQATTSSLTRVIMGFDCAGTRSTARLPVVGDFTQTLSVPTSLPKIRNRPERQPQ
jgi:hypothetical protein